MKGQVTAFFSVAYPNARYSAMGNEFITRTGVGRVVTARNLQESIGASSSKDFQFHETDMDRLDREIDTLMTSVIEMVKSEMPSITGPIFDVFLLRHELLTLKRIIRALYHRVDWYADPVGSLDHKTLQLLKEVEDLQDLQYTLRFTPYSELIGEAFGENIPELDELDAMLDGFYFQQLERTISNVRIWRKPYREYLNFFSDIQNIKLVLRLRGIGKELEPGTILGSGTGIGEWELQQMATADTLSEALRHLQGTPYEFPAENIFTAEKELDRKLLNLTNDLARRYINTAGPSLHFVQAREFEIGNLRKIFRGVSEGIPPREIEKELILID